jgi:tRNA pseudouridine38-40 synthase
MLPKDIVVFKVVQVPDGFHCRFDATSRTYRYFILKSRKPFLADYAWHCHLKLAIEQMNAAAQLLLKFEDFSAFSKGRTQVKTNICHISKAHWMETETMYVFEISADRFLRNMVRAIVGTLMQVGLGKLNQGEFEQIIASKSRTKASDSVPGCGLFLTNVSYPNFLLMDLGIAYKEIPFSITG